MALRHCRECGGHVGTESMACPHCGAVLTLDATVPGLTGLREAIPEQRWQVHHHLIVWVPEIGVILGSHNTRPRNRPDSRCAERYSSPSSRFP